MHTLEPCSAGLFRAAEQGHDSRQEWRLSCNSHSIQDIFDVSRLTCLLVLMLHALSHRVLILHALSHCVLMLHALHDVACQSSHCYMTWLVKYGACVHTVY